MNISPSLKYVVWVLVAIGATSAIETKAAKAAEHHAWCDVIDQSENWGRAYFVVSEDSDLFTNSSGQQRRNIKLKSTKFSFFTKDTPSPAWNALFSQSSPPVANYASGPSRGHTNTFGLTIHTGNPLWIHLGARINVTLGSDVRQKHCNVFLVLYPDGSSEVVR